MNKLRYEKESPMSHLKPKILKEAEDLTWKELNFDKYANYNYENMNPNYGFPSARNRLTPFDMLGTLKTNNNFSTGILTPSNTTSFTKTMKTTMISNSNTEETRQLMKEIREIRNEIKNATMGYEADLPSSKEYKIHSYDIPWTHAKEQKANDQRQKLHQQKQKRTSHALNYIKKQIDKQIKTIEHEKENQEIEINGLERKLDKWLSKITKFGKQRIKESKEVHDKYQKELKEVKDFYKDKLTLIRSENQKNKNFSKELIFSRESEFERVQNQIYDFGKVKKDEIDLLRLKIKQLSHKHQNLSTKSNKTDYHIDNQKLDNCHLQKQNESLLDTKCLLMDGISHLEQVNSTMKLWIEKLQGFAYGKPLPKSVKKSSSMNRCLQKSNEVSSNVLKQSSSSKF